MSEVVNLLRHRLTQSDDTSSIRLNVAVRNRMIQLLERHLKNQPEGTVLEFVCPESHLDAVNEAIQSSVVNNSYQVTHHSSFMKEGIPHYILHASLRPLDLGL